MFFTPFLMHPSFFYEYKLFIYPDKIKVIEADKEMQHG